MEVIFEQSHRSIAAIDRAFYRSLYDKTDWNCRLIEINGARGVGKTTLLLQRAHEIAKEVPNKVLYMSLDDPYIFSKLAERINPTNRFRKYQTLSEL